MNLVHSRSQRSSRLHPRLLAGLLAGALLLVFAGLAEDVWMKEAFAWDAPLMLALHTMSRPWLDTLMLAITQTGEYGAILVVAVIGLWLGWRRRFLDAATVLGAFGGAVALNSALKLIFGRPRPAVFPPLVAETGFSFPSGHVAASTAVYGLLALWLWCNRRYGWALLSAGWVLLVAISRVYLGVHYPSDVLASLDVGALWLLLVTVVYTWYRTSWLPRRSRPNPPAPNPSHR